MNVRVKGEDGTFKLVEMTKVYDQEEGSYRFEEFEGQEMRKRSVESAQLVTPLVYLCKSELSKTYWYPVSWYPGMDRR